jgi:hypothetical protein
MSPVRPSSPDQSPGHTRRAGLRPVRRSRRPVHVAVLTATLTTIGIVSATPASAGPPAYDYTVTLHVQETHVAGDGEALCGTPESAEYSGSRTIRLRSTALGLSDQQVIALTEGEPDSTVLEASSEGGGTLVQRSGPHTYTMRYNDRWHMTLRSPVISGTSSFLATGESENGTPYSIHQWGFHVESGGRTVADGGDLSVKGCLP